MTTPTKPHHAQLAHLRRTNPSAADTYERTHARAIAEERGPVSVRMLDVAAATNPLDRARVMAATPGAAGEAMRERLAAEQIAMREAAQGPTSNTNPIIAAREALAPKAG